MRTIARACLCAAAGGWFVAAGLPGPACAAAWRAAPLASVEIVDRTAGIRLPLLGRPGERWVAGVPGHRYAIALRNQSGGRLLAVAAVDGVNVNTGETAGWLQSGYVLDPGAGYEIAGWRKSTERIAAFEFAALPDSYAARTGRPDNVGVIGIALFREAAPPQALAPRAAPAPSAAAEAGAAKAQSADDAGATRLGTGHGRGEDAPVTLTRFARAQDVPDEVITIRYDRRENLIAMGVLAAPVAAPPNPFPDSTAGFVPDPPAR